MDRISTQESDGDKEPLFDQKRKDQDLNALKMAEQDFRIYNKVFDEMDINSNGSVSQDEFEKVLKIYYKDSSFAQDYVDMNFSAIDKDHNGSITLFEFLYAIENGHCPLLVNLVDMIGKEEENADKFEKLEQLKKNQLLFDNANPIPYARDVLHMPEFQRNKYQKAFSLIDLDNSGRITRLEFDIIVRHFGLIKNATPDDITELYNTIDVDCSGEITLLEFWSCLGGDKPLKKLAAMIDTILKKEKDILNFIKKQGIKRMPTQVPALAKAKAAEDEADLIKRRLEERIMELERGFMGQIEEMDKMISGKDQEIGRLGGLLKEKSDENAGLVEVKEGLEKKTEEFEKEIGGLREDKKRLAEKEVKIAAIKKIIENTAQYIKTKSPEKVKPKSEKTTPEKPKQSYKDHLEVIKNAFEEKESEISELIRRIKDFENEKNSLQETLKSQNVKLQALKSEHSDLNTTFISVGLENQELKEVESDLKARVEELEKAKEGLTVDLTKTKNELEKAQASSQASLKEIERLSTQLSTMISMEEFNKLVEEKGDSKDVNQDLLASESVLKQQKLRLEEENESLKERVNQLEQYKEETMVELAFLTTDVEDAKSKAAQGEHEIQQLNGRLFSLGTENGQLKEKAAQLESYKEEKVTEITRLTASLEEYKTKAVEHQLEIQKLNHRLSTMTGHEEVEKLKKEINSLVYQVESLNKDISILKDQKSSIEAEKNLLSDKVKKLEQQKEEELVNNNKLTRNLSEEKVTIAENLSEIRSLKEKVSVLSDEIDRLKTEKDALVQENESLKKPNEPVMFTRDHETVRTIAREEVRDVERSKRSGNRNLERFGEGDLEFVQAPTHSPLEEIERLNNVIANMVSREDMFRALSERDGIMNEHLRFRDGIFRSIRALSWVNGLKAMK